MLWKMDSFTGVLLDAGNLMAWQEPQMRIQFRSVRNRPWSMHIVLQCFCSDDGDHYVPRGCSAQDWLESMVKTL
jgi:hypothetical protein